MMNDLCDEKRFKKAVGVALQQLRSGVNDGLLTAYDGEENWGTAHRVLVPAFGPLNINGMFDNMKDIASQLVMKWARHGESYRIPVSDDFTRLTLDTLVSARSSHKSSTRGSLPPASSSIPTHET